MKNSNQVNTKELFSIKTINEGRLSSKEMSKVKGGEMCSNLFIDCIIKIQVPLTRPNTGTIAIVGFCACNANF